MELLKKLKTAPVPEKRPEPEEKLKYLEDENLNRIVNKGLAELYRLQPRNPITFLSNWLLNESYSVQILNKIAADNDTKIKITKKKEEEAKVLAEITAQHEAIEKEDNDKKEKLRQSIITCEDYEDNLNDICDQFKDIIHATGVYISKYEVKRVEVKSVDDDENAHLDPEGTKVLRFIHYNKDHEFLHGKYIEPGKGVTYQLFKKVGDEEDEEEGEEEPKKENPEGGEEEEEEKDDKPDEIKSVLIDDVVNSPKVVFFREPRLGAYYAFNVTYKSSLNYKSLLSAIDCLTEYNKKLEEIEKKKQEKEEEEKNGEHEGEEGEGGEGEENEEEEEDKSKKSEEKSGEEEEGEEGEKNKDEKLELADFEKEEKIMIFALDTLGQDRTFSDKEKEFANEIAKLLRDSIQEHEKKLLEKDRDLRIEYLKMEKPLQEEWTEDKIYAEEENAVREYLNSDDFLVKNVQDEAQKKVETDFAKANMIIQSIIGSDFQTLLEMFDKFEFVEYEKIFQNIFYFCRIEPKDINEPETNKLSWKRARTKWPEILEYCKNYQALGAKPGKIESIFKGNIILDKLTPFTTEEKIEEISKYSFTLTRLLTYIVHILKVRKDDIIYRHTEQRQRIKERNDIIKKNKEIDDLMAKELKKAKAKFLGKEVEEEEKGEGEEEEGEEKEDESKKEEEEEEEEEKEEEKKQEPEEKKEGEEEKKEGEEEFNEEEWKTLFEQEHPKTPVPDEIEVDLDEDFDVDEGAVPNKEGEEEEEEDGSESEK